MLGFRKTCSGAECEAIIHEIAERSAVATLSQLSTIAERMNAAQLRGYVRAHAWPEVWGKLQDAAADGRLTNTQVNELAGRALEQTVQAVARAYLVAPVVALPTPHIGRRAAA
jgi:hypothetical protein